ncbi:hypothetical protein [Nocardioides sp. T2.26MG-1]|uniref:hypothetical protein n=1 Tax=Nocardioides sp. T2.26MG-1 TaxID=3041166 RepID=UPI002477BC94|nr:hypothetical protein [Nocardioides sp. T2.26MG-1]CAI9417355.1 hypothetical protein HIDPHFAB_02999 [Nocardioides sp. T2.26MG-1]
MATLTPVQAALAGTTVTMAPASAGGDKVDGGSDVAVLVTNGSAAPVDVTIAVPGNTRAGQPEPDVVIAVPAGASKLIGPLAEFLEDRATDSLVAISYSATTTVTVAALKI